MTIKEIAKLAGVSSAAVSRYLNGGYVSEEKKRTDTQCDRKDGISAFCAGENPTDEKSKSCGGCRSKD